MVVPTLTPPRFVNRQLVNLLPVGIHGVSLFCIFFLFDAQKPNGELSLHFFIILANPTRGGEVVLTSGYQTGF